MFNVLQHATINPTYNPLSSYDKPVVGFERDGVLNRLGPDGYVRNRGMYEPIPGSLEAVAMIRAKGYKVAIITDQGGIAKGMMKHNDVEDVNQYMFELLGKAGCPSIDALYYSESSEKKDMYAKPNTGMFKRCERENPHIRFSKGWYIGHSIQDLKAAVRCGAKPVLVRTGYGIETEYELNKFAYRDIRKKVEVYDNLMEFARYLN